MRNEQTKETQNMSEETIQGEHRKPLFQRLRDICGCLTTEDDCDEIARVVFESYPVVFESYPTNEKMSEEIHPDTKSLHAALFLLADIRRAVGYPSTKLVRSKMVEHCREIYKRAQSKDCHICNDVRKQLKGLPESKLHGDDGLAAATMRGFDRLSENEDNWQAKYYHLVESLPKNKRPFSDKQAQKVIASQVKRITQLEDDLSFVRCELDKLRKETR